MAGRCNYNTKQRETILSYLAKNSGRPLTAEMMANDLSGSVGKTTVYRNLDYLAKKKAVIKVDIPDGKGAYYQYMDSSNGNSCHLLCTGCGKIIDADCNFVSELSVHVRKEHQFKLDNLKTVLYGLCKSCTS